MAVTLTKLTSGASTASSATTVTASITVTGGVPLILVLLGHFSAGNFGLSTITWDGGGGQAIDGIGGAMSADGAGTDDAYCNIRYLDNPTGGTGTITITHSSGVSTYRHWYVYQPSGHDTSTSTAWRDTFTGGTTIGGTTHETALTSAAGDYPLLAVGLFQSASAPSLTLNGSSTQVETQSHSTFRSYVLTGTGAASVTLGGTTGSNTQSARRGFNINAAGAGSATPVPVFLNQYRQRWS